MDARLVQGVTDPVSGPQRYLPLGGQAAGQDDDTLKIAHDFEIRPLLGYGSRSEVIPQLHLGLDHRGEPADALADAVRSGEGVAEPGVLAARAVRVEARARHVGDPGRD